MKVYERLIGFLQSELSIPAHSIKLALKSGERDPTLLSIILWQYGLLTLEQLGQVFDWLEL
jgi:hypothetical protein